MLSRGYEAWMTAVDPKPDVRPCNGAGDRRKSVI